MLFSQHALFWWRGRDLNSRPLGYEPNELPGCSTPRRGVEYRQAGRGLSIVALRDVGRVGEEPRSGDASARARRRRRLVVGLEQEEDLAGTTQPQLFAGDLLDAVGVVLQAVDVGGQAVVRLVERRHLVLEPGQQVALAEPLDEPHVAEQGVEQQRQGDEPEEDDER